MILSKKYIFETKSTRLKRVLINSVILSLIFASLFSGVLYYIPSYAQNQNQRTQAFLIKDTPDIIAVYTGDFGRIEEALKIAQSYPSAKVFISGVYKKNSFKTLLNKQIDHPDEFLQNKNIDAEIDYKSQNTLENVISTIRFADKNEKVRNVIVVSSDYHILRMSILESIVLNGRSYNFYYHSLPSNYSKWSNLKKLIKESIKILKTFGVYFLWDD